MGSPTWTILVPTLGCRHVFFSRLMEHLAPQVKPFDGEVTVCAYRNNGERPLPDIRQSLVEHTEAKYLSFIDDDDMVSPLYVREGMKALADDPDYVGWKVMVYQNGSPRWLAFHSLGHGGWFTDRRHRHLYRDISDKNIVRASMAKQADYRISPPGHSGEDRLWATQLRGTLKKEVYLDLVMYHYYVNQESGSWRQLNRATKPCPTINVKSPHFAWHPESVL